MARRESKAKDSADQAVESALAEIASAGLAHADDRDVIAEAERRGFIIHVNDRAEPHIDLEPATKGRVRIGIVSDTHLGNKYQQLTHWRSFAKECEEAKVDFMFHGGDVVDGTNMHKDQQYELFQHGSYAQGKYAIENIPPVKVGRKHRRYHVIGGNHDGSFWKDSGANVLDHIQSKRDDFVYLGASAATFHIEGLSIMLMHPDGGVPYARSYKPQKIAEQIAPEDKPHVLFFGHWHVQCFIPSYRNIAVMSGPCFQAQTPYLKRKGLFPEVGGVILEIEYSEYGLESIKPNFIGYKRMHEKDW